MLKKKLIREGPQTLAAAAEIVVAVVVAVVGDRGYLGHGDTWVTKGFTMLHVFYFIFISVSF